MSDEVKLYEGLVFKLPKQPVKEKIQGYDLPKKAQKWFRYEIPENWDDLTEEEQYDFVQEEDRKCTEGHWFYNNGIPTYITGDNYFYLNWFKIDIGYPSYFDKDRRWFYVAKICDDDDNCFGLLYAKKRRDGFSYRAASRVLNSARRTPNSNYGMMSKTGDDAKELFAKVIYAFKELPDFFKPQVESAETPKKELVFSEPQQRVSHKNRKAKHGISLNTKINWKNTSNNSYDSTKQRRLIADEVGKMEEADFEKWLPVVLTCFTKGGDIIGKGDFGTTVNESNKGGKAFEKVWLNSSSLNKNENNRTVSGLYRYFIPAYEGLEGYMDEYGMSIIDDPEAPIKNEYGKLVSIGAKTFLLNELNAKKKNGDIVGYYERLRQFPFNESDLFREPANDATVFELDKIYEQLEHNEISNVDRQVRRGNFEWVGGERDTSVEWVDSPQGRWLMYWLPLVGDRNKITTLNGKKSPANTHIGCFSLDPYSAKKTVSNKNSMAASHGFRKYDMLDPDFPPHFVTEYWARPSDPLIVYEDMIKQCVLYGWKLLLEKNKNNAYDYFRLRGYDNYLMNKPALTEQDFLKNVQKKREEDPGLSNTGEAVRQQMLEHMQNYIVNNIGINNDTGKIGFCPFNNTLNDWAKFNPDSWTDYDLTVSSMLAVIASKEFVKPKKKVIKTSFFPTYRHVGNTSVLIKQQG